MLFSHYKGELLFGSVELVNFGVGADFVLQVKCTIFWLNRVLSLYIDLYAPDFQKVPLSTFFTNIIRKYGLCASQQYVIFGCNVFF